MDELADVVYRLGQLGQLDPAFMDEVIRTARRQYRGGEQGGVQALTNLLGAMASVRYGNDVIIQTI